MPEISQKSHQDGNENFFTGFSGIKTRQRKKQAL
jgi:hypothetical protein